MTTRTIRIRMAEPDDASALAAVHDAAWAEAYRGIIPGKALNRMIERRGVGWWQQALAHGSRIVVLDFHDTVAGYASFGPCRGHGSPSRSLRARGELYELYLAPEYQGVGLGRRLFAGVRRELIQSGLDPFIVWCLADNNRAVAFYEALGGKRAAEGQEVFDGLRCDRIAFLWQRT